MSFLQSSYKPVEAKSAPTRAEFARCQIDSEVERARIDATLNALYEGGKTEAALAAAKVPEAATDSGDGKSEVVVPGLPLFPAV